MVAIIGAGIAGASTAYYLSCFLSPSSQLQPITIFDPNGQPSSDSACTASSKAGAFLSNSWGDGTKRQALFHKSYDLHKELAADLNLASFRELSTVYRGVNGEDCEGADGSLPFQVLRGQSAMVDPHELTSSLLEKAMERGASLQKLSVEGLKLSPSSESDDARGSSQISNKDMLATAIIFDDGSKFMLKDEEPVVIALGPWSSRVEDWLNVPVPIDGVVSTSLVWKDVYNDEGNGYNHDDNHRGIALFCEEDSNGCHLEIYPRIHDQSIYVSGCGQSEVLSPSIFRNRDQKPNPTQHCQPNMSRAQAAQKSIKELLSPSSTVKGLLPNKLKTKLPDVIQACIRPTTPDGVPMIGKLLNNVYIGTGGGPWGITWGPLMGKSLASLILDDEDTPMPMGPFRPSRFDTVVYRSLLKSRSNGGSLERETR